MLAVFIVLIVLLQRHDLSDVYSYLRARLVCGIVMYAEQSNVLCE